MGSTANAYRIYEFLVDREWLAPGTNRLTVYMKSFSRMIAPVRERAECLKRDGRTEGMLGKALIDPKAIWVEEIHTGTSRLVHSSRLGVMLLYEIG